MGKVAVLADIHSNIVALDAVLKDCEKEKVDHFIVAGDLIGYYYWPDLVVRKIFGDPRFVCIAGNHEQMLKASLWDDAYANRMKKKYGSGLDRCKATLTKSEINWLINLPPSLRISFSSLEFGIHHGSPADTCAYIYPDADKKSLTSAMTDSDFTVLDTHYRSFSHTKAKFC